MLERRFRLPENRTSVRVELLPGITIFLTTVCILAAILIAYFIFSRGRMG
jgi:xanthine/uracil/vitamin C permease (AzgA family)